MASVILLLCCGFIPVILAAGGGNFPNYGHATPKPYHVPDNDCYKAVEDCKIRHPQLAYNSLPKHVYSPADYNEHCGSMSFSACLTAIDSSATGCSILQDLDLQGQIKAEEYVCSDGGKKKYSAKTEFSDTPWKILSEWYMENENHMCDENFLAFSYGHFEDSEHILLEIDALPEDATGNDVLTIEKRSRAELDVYCNYMYAYQDCLYNAAKRHANDSIGDWQYDVVKEYYTPHFDRAICHIGKGLTPVTLTAIVLVSVILALIFALACICGVYEKCFERCKKFKSKRRSDDEDKLRPGPVQRSNSKVTFAFDNPGKEDSV